MIPDNEVESGFVGMMLANDEAVINLKRFPKQEWFSNKELGKISEAINKTQSIDPLEISKASGAGAATLIKLTLDAPVSLNPDAYVNEIFELYKGRFISDIGYRWTNPTNYDEAFFERVESDMANIQHISGGIHDCVFTDEVLEGWIADKEKRIRGEIKPIKSGFPSIDAVFAGGLHRQDLITVAGRPGSGKSALLKSAYCNMVKHDPGVKVAIFSIEMSPNEYMDRMCAEYARIDGKKLRQGHTLSHDEMDAMMDFARVFHEFKFSFNRAQDCTVHDIARLARATKFKLGGLDCVFVDHLHIIQNHNAKLNEVDRLGEISIGLKRLAQQLDVPVMMAAQCNRASEREGGRMPLMSDLRGSGAIEQDSNCIIFVHRPGLNDTAIDASLADVVVRKNRHGPSPLNLKFKFEKEFTAFLELKGC